MTPIVNQDLLKLNTAQRQFYEYPHNIIINFMEDNEKDLINTKQFVILVDNRGEQRLLKPHDHKNFKWRKISVKLQQQLGEFEYFQTIEVGNDKLNKVQEVFEEDEDEAAEAIDEDELMENANNKEIYTLGQAQKLKPEQINDLKATKKGEQIIQTIVENNEQFQKRTVYSKEKYLNKKKKKYLFQFHAEPTTLENVHKFYFLTDPKSVNWIRWDMLGFLFLQAGPFGRVLLSEKTKGIILGGILRRQFASVTVVGEQVKNMKRFPIVEQLNIQKDTTKDKVSFTQWKKLKQQVEAEANSAVKYDNLILAGNYDFQGIILTLLPALANNCLITFYCQTIEPLQAAVQAIGQHPDIIHVKVFDSWARQYQVLRNRTHPMMYMSSHPGYLLTAIRVGGLI